MSSILFDAMLGADRTVYSAAAGSLLCPDAGIYVFWSERITYTMVYYSVSADRGR